MITRNNFSISNSRVVLYNLLSSYSSDNRDDNDSRNLNRNLNRSDFSIGANTAESMELTVENYDRDTSYNL